MVGIRVVDPRRSSVVGSGDEGSGTNIGRCWVGVGVVVGERRCCKVVVMGCQVSSERSVADVHEGLTSCLATFGYTASVRGAGAGAGYGVGWFDRVGSNRGRVRSLEGVEWAE